MTAPRLVTLLRRCGRRNDPALVAQILGDLKTPALRQPSQVETALGTTVVSLLVILTAMHTAVESLEKALAVEFAQHPLEAVLRSAPGLGPILAARVLAEVGDDKTRFGTAGGLRAFAGTAPVTRASGRSRYVKARKVRNKRLGDSCHWWAFAMLTKSPAHASTTTVDEPPATTTTQHCGTWRTSSSAACGGAYSTTRCGTNKRPGPTWPSPSKPSPLDK